jgi:hypothetical protein
MPGRLRRDAIDAAADDFQVASARLQAGGGHGPAAAALSGQRWSFHGIEWVQARRSLRHHRRAPQAGRPRETPPGAGAGDLLAYRSTLADVETAWRDLSQFRPETVRAPCALARSRSGIRSLLATSDLKSGRPVQRATAFRRRRPAFLGLPSPILKASSRRCCA